MARWSRGVDLHLFRPRPKRSLGKPLALYVGRVAKEKNIEAFLETDVDCHKWVVGEGPHLAYLKKKYPSAKYLGCLRGEPLASVYAQADVFVFPSRTDTYGLVLLEALASGLPIAGFPVDSTRDVVAGAPVAVLDEDLRSACLQSLTLSRAACRSYAKTMTWEESARCFLANLKNSGALRARHEPQSSLVPAA
jgi:glycosyltransferase involved in cell wall biosynthesis